MKGSVASDLHLEHHALADLPGGDLLLLSGDVWAVAPMRPKAQDADSRAWRKRYTKFCQEELIKYKHVLLIMGNHEHYGGIFEDTADILRTFLSAHAPHAILLDNETTEVDGVVFIGTTLWAPYGFGTWQHIAIQKGMNDFHCIRTMERLDEYPTPSRGRTLVVPDIYKQYVNAKLFLEDALRLNQGKPTVVMTHHAPSHLCLVEQSREFNDAYASNQHNLLDSFDIAMWTYGHTHDNKRVRVNHTLIVSNQRGYFGFERRANYFDITEADFTLEEVRNKKLFSSQGENCGSAY
jgi:DNA repair exonuclease SbcCD nuclease subunit